MIRRLVAELEHLHLALRVGGRVGQHGPQVRILHVVGAGVRREDAPGRQALHRAKVDFLVAPKGPLHRRLGLRERRGIQDDDVVGRLLAVRGVVQPVEDIGDVEAHLDPVSPGVASGRLDGVGGAVEAPHVGGSGLGGVDRE